MRVVTTAHKAGLDLYGHRWIESRKNWPAGTEFWWYTEGYTIEPDGMVVHDFEEQRDFIEWKAKHANYRPPPSWRWDVVAYAHKVFAACDALKDYKGVGVWLDADCVTYAKIPDGLIESYVQDAYIAHYNRPGIYTETGLWIMDCSHECHESFLNSWRAWYLSDRFKTLAQWHDCMTFDATLKQFKKEGLIRTHDLSGQFGKMLHPQAMTELGKYIDHCKGARKDLGYSPEAEPVQDGYYY